MSDKLKHQDDSIMSEGYGIIPKKVMKLPIQCEAKAIYAYMCSYAGGGNTAFPGVKRMLNDLNISETRFYKFRKELITTGLITVTNTRNCGKQGNNIYTLNHSINICTEFQHPRFQGTEFQHPENEHPENEGSNNNSLLNNNSTNNNNTKLLLTEEAVVKVKNLLGAQFDDNKAKQILKIAGNDIDVVMEKWDIVQSMDNVKDISKLLYVAIRDDYKPSAGSNKVSGFGNYEQRTYDMNDLEKKLLGLD
ncbi:MAG: helix-turn-helix domain-containing protein [Clostridium sp.]